MNGPIFRGRWLLPNHRVVLLLRQAITVVVLLLLIGSRMFAATPSKHVLLVGIDGCRGDAIEYSQAKHLKQLIGEGAYTDKIDVLGDRITGADTASGAGWAAIINGVWADKHGVPANDFRNNKLAKYPSFLQRIKQVEPHTEVAAFTTWQPMYEHCFGKADYVRFVTDGDKQGYEMGDRLVGAEAAKYLQTNKPTAMMVYFGNTDAAGHGYGFHPKSYKYTNAIESVDLQLGLVLEALRGRASYQNEDWLIVVCTDHGGKAKGHSLGREEPEIRYGFCIIHGRQVQPGSKLAKTHSNVDLAPTVMQHLDIQPAEDWKLDGKPITFGKAMTK